MKLKIAVVYAFHSPYCGPTYTIAALMRMGHDVDRLIPDQYFSSSPDKYDLFWCQDSGEGIDFRRADDAHLKKTSYWIWDSRFNRIQRQPIGDDDMAQLISDNGGWVFQAQTPDVDRLSRERRLERMSWLPIGADPYLWECEPVEDKIYPISFVGNCYDNGRGAVLDYAVKECGLHWPGPNGAFVGEAARVYRQSCAVLHVPTFYQLPHDATGERIDYDLTMRPYEAMACGVPLVTPTLPDYAAVGFVEGQHIFVYNQVEEIPVALGRAKVKAQSPDCRLNCRLLAENNSYELRLQSAFTTLRRVGVLNA